MKDEDLYELLVDNVNDIFDNYYPSLSDKLKNEVINFIIQDYNVKIARDSRYLPTAVEVACCYITNKPVMTRQLIPLYYYFENSKVDLLRNKYYECRKLLIQNPKIINLVFGTKITNETPKNRVFSIHEKIKNLGNALMFERSNRIIKGIREMQANGEEKLKVDINKLESRIKRIMMAFDTINTIESKGTKKIQKLVSDVNSECYGITPDEVLDKTHNGKK